MHGAEQLSRAVLESGLSTRIFYDDFPDDVPPKIRFLSIKTTILVNSSRKGKRDLAGSSVSSTTTRLWSRCGQLFILSLPFDHPVCSLIRCLNKVGNSLRQMPRNCFLVTSYGYNTTSFWRRFYLLFFRCLIRLNRPSTNPDHSILNDAVHAYMEQIGEGHHEDVLRTFFRSRIADIGNIIEKVVAITNEASVATGHDEIVFLPEANRIILVSTLSWDMNEFFTNTGQTITQSAFDYRDYNLGVYGVRLPMLNPWTSRPAVLDAILSLFNATARATESPSTRHHVSNRQSEPGSQLPDLAAGLFACMQERLDWLGRYTSNSFVVEDGWNDM